MGWFLRFIVAVVLSFAIASFLVDWLLAEYLANLQSYSPNSIGLSMLDEGIRVATIVACVLALGKPLKLL